jgi:hypothetical protein
MPRRGSMNRRRSGYEENEDGGNQLKTERNGGVF